MEGLKPKSDKRYTITLDDDPLIHKIFAQMTNMVSLPFSSAKKLLGRANQLDPVAVFIDIHLNLDECGLDIIPELRKVWTYTPIIVATGSNDDSLVGSALACGADDFIRKPINKDEFLGRLNARVTEMRKRRGDSEIKVNGVTYNRISRSLTKNDRSVYLPHLEGELFYILAEHLGVSEKKEDIKRKLWGNLKVSANTLDKKISNLRKSLDSLDSTLEIKSLYGLGLVLRVRD